MNEKELHKRLGIAPGATIIELIKLCEKISPEHPWNAFGPLCLLLPWLKPGKTAADMRYGTPKNVHPFAETGGDLNHFGFLMDGNTPTDERPIVYVEVKNDDEATSIVAPNLRSFLGLVSISDGDVISREATDAEWFNYRKKCYGDDSALLKEMERLSDLMCSISGVVRPPSPSTVANSHPNQIFRLFFEDELEDGEEIGAKKETYSSLNSARKATALAQQALEDSRLDVAIQQARLGMQHPAYKPRCLYVLTKAYQLSGQKDIAKSTAEDLLNAWLDPAPIQLPGVHTRKVVDQEELIFLLEEVHGEHAAPIIKQVLETSDVEEPSGDFL